MGTASFRQPEIWWKVIFKWPCWMMRWTRFLMISLQDKSWTCPGPFKLSLSLSLWCVGTFSGRFVGLTGRETSGLVVDTVGCGVTMGFNILAMIYCVHSNHRTCCKVSSNINPKNIYRKLKIILMVERKSVFTSSVQKRIIVATFWPCFGNFNKYIY